MIIGAVLIVIAGAAALYFAFFWSPTPPTATLPSPAPTEEGFAEPAPIPVAPPAPGAVVSGTYTHADGFSLTPPSGWTSDESGTLGTKVIFRAPATDQGTGGPFTANVTVVVEEAGSTTLDEAMTAAKEAGALLVNYRLIDDARAVTSAGLPAHILGGTFKEGGTIRNKQLIVIVDGKKYAITGTALAAAWETHAYNATFDAALTSFAARPQ